MGWEVYRRILDGHDGKSSSQSDALYLFVSFICGRQLRFPYPKISFLWEKWRENVFAIWCVFFFVGPQCSVLRGIQFVWDDRHFFFWYGYETSIRHTTFLFHFFVKGGSWAYCFYLHFLIDWMVSCVCSLLLGFGLPEWRFGSLNDGGLFWILRRKRFLGLVERKRGFT